MSEPPSRSRRAFLGATAITTATSLAGCGDDGPRPRQRLPFRAGDRRFERERDGSFEPFLIRGINMGMAKPAHFPGEAAITRSEYDRWFRDIGQLNPTPIRTYTIHPPAFYDALSAYNDRASEPLYLFQGSWIGE